MHTIWEFSAKVWTLASPTRINLYPYHAKDGKLPWFDWNKEIETDITGQNNVPACQTNQKVRKIHRSHYSSSNIYIVTIKIISWIILIPFTSTSTQDDFLNTRRAKPTITIWQGKVQVGIFLAVLHASKIILITAIIFDWMLGSSKSQRNGL